jgi:RHS repeat-associated protein
VKGSSGAILSLDAYPNHIAHVNPIRYRGYYYDNETGFYYLQSRYYDPVISRFINADSYGSTGQGFLGTNMFAYCQNNPLTYSDPTGTISIVPNKRLAMADTGPVGGGGGGGGLIILGVLRLIEAVTTKAATSTITIVPATVIDDVDVKIDTKTETKEKEKQQAYFPVDPFQFAPRGLIMRVYPGSKNGRIIKWMDPITKIPIFEWNEDFVNGAHYHALLPEWGGKHDGLHYLPGTSVPEPWNSIYFGG